MGHIEDMLIDIVDAWWMNDKEMTERKIKKAYKYYEEKRLNKKSTAPKTNYFKRRQK